MSVKYRGTIGQVSVKCRSSIGDTVERRSAVECRPLCRPTIGRPSVDTIGRLSADSVAVDSRSWVLIMDMISYYFVIRFLLSSTFIFRYICAYQHKTYQVFVYWWHVRLYDTLSTFVTQRARIRKPNDLRRILSLTEIGGTDVAVGNHLNLIQVSSTGRHGAIKRSAMSWPTEMGANLGQNTGVLWQGAKIVIGQNAAKAFRCFLMRKWIDLRQWLPKFEKHDPCYGRPDAGIFAQSGRVMGRGLWRLTE